MIVAAGAGFLLAVLWFDLMFDVQVRGHDRAKPLPERVLASIAGYYARVTTAARPMNFLVAAAMLVVLGGLIEDIATGDGDDQIAWFSLLFAMLAIGRAAQNTVPSARRMGTRADPVEDQSAMARSVYQDHVVAFVCIAAVLTLQLGFAY